MEKIFHFPFENQEIGDTIALSGMGKIKIELTNNKKVLMHSNIVYDWLKNEDNNYRIRFIYIGNNIYQVDWDMSSGSWSYA